jgi:membrane dipeptidase
MNRRQLVSGIGPLVLIGPAVGPGIAAEGDPGPGDPAAPTVAPAARDLYRRSVVVDCNLAPAVEGLPLSAADLDMYRNCGLTAIKTTIGGYADDFQVRTVQDISVAKRDRRLGILFSFEGVGMLEGQLERIELFRGRLECAQPV